MAKAPSLVNLCAGSLKNHILHGGDDGDDWILNGIYELPTELFDCVLKQLPAFALHKFQLKMPSEKQNEYFEYDCSGKGRKRVRCGKFDAAWKTLFHLRWPENVKHHQMKKSELENETVCDWRQKYWDKHLQNCFDAATEVVILPSYDDCVCVAELPDGLLKAIGIEQQAKTSNRDYSMLRSHCKEFGRYVRCLRLHNVFCNLQTCRVISSCELKDLTLKRINRREHVDGLCKILYQNNETLESVEFTNCKLFPRDLEAICSCLWPTDTKMHGIKHFAVKSTSFVEGPLLFLRSWPPNLLNFISQPSLESLEFSDVCIDKNIAKMIFMTLITASSGISSLDLSENNISGGLSDFRHDVSNQGLSSRDISKCLQFLRVLNLRANKLSKRDMDDLRSALVLMPALKDLDVSYNPIEDDGIKSLIPYFINSVEQVPLANLNLESCKLSCTGANELLELLSALKYPLNSLSLADNVLGSRVAAAVGDFLSTTITSLDIRDIDLGSSGFLELEINLPNVVNLHSIDISENRGKIQAAEFLKALIERAPELRGVHAGFNLLPRESVMIMAPALDFHGKLEVVDLRGNSKLCWNHSASSEAATQHNKRPDPAPSDAAAQHNEGPEILISFFEPGLVYDDEP